MLALIFTTKNNVGFYYIAHILLFASPDQLNFISLSLVISQPVKSQWLYFYIFRCLFDYVDIFTIDPFGMKHPEDRFCGQDIPEPLVSIHNKVELVFKSDYAGSNKGFVGHYKFVEESKSILSDSFLMQPRSFVLEHVWID